MREWRYIGNGTSLELDQGACTGCGACVAVCPHGVFVLRSADDTGSVPQEAQGDATRQQAVTASHGAKIRGAKIRGAKIRVAAIRDRSLCMECGACARNCPERAIGVAAGVGCAAAIIGGKIRGTAPSCGCGSDAKSGAQSGAKDGASGSCCC